MERVPSHGMNGGSGEDHMARNALRPSDFITSPTSLKGRLREAGFREQILEGAAGTAASDMARRFAPDSPSGDDEDQADSSAESKYEPWRPEPQIGRFPSVPPEEKSLRARTSPWILLALIIACGTPSAIAGFMMWNGSLPIPFAEHFGQQEAAETQVAAMPAPDAPAADAPAAAPPAAQEPAAPPAAPEPAAAPPAPAPEVAQQPEAQPRESMPPKNQDRMEAAVSALSDPANKSSIQEKTAGVSEARAAPAPLQIVVKPIEGAHAAMQAELAVAVEPSIPDGLGSRVLVKDLPQNATLSAGKKSADGWTLTVDDLTGLKLNLPADAAGDAVVKVELRSESGEVLAETSMPLHVEPAPVLRPDYVSRIAGLMEHGQKMIDVGYISGARAYYIRAAEAGSAEGAMAAAATFDPAALDALQAHGVQSDVSQARRWYERAKELGAKDADSRVAGLPAE